MGSGDDKMLGGYLREDEKLLLSLEETVDPKHTALVVVDMQNDYVHGRGQTVPVPGEPLNAYQKVAPNLVAFVEACRKVGVPIFWVITRHGPDIDFPAYKARIARRGEGPVAMEGTKGAELIRELVPRKGERMFVKHGYDGFTGNDLDICLKNRGIATLIMSGVVTNTCVDATLKHGFHLGYYIVAGSDIMAAVEQQVQDIYLRSFAEHYGLVVSSREIAKIWGVALELRESSP